MRLLKLIITLTLLMFIFSNGVFAQKANLENYRLEFNNLKMDKTYRTIFGKVSQESRVARYIYNEDFGPLSGTAEQMARQYLEENAVRFGIVNIESQLQVAHTVSSPGGQHVTYNQYLNGIPVFRSEIVITINNENIVSFVASNFRPNLDIQNFNTSVSASKAISIAKNYLNVAGKLLGEPKAELMIFDSKDKGAQLAYRTQITTEKPMGDWEIFVNAQNGEIIHVKDRMMYQNKATGSGMAFDPDPLTSAGIYYGGQYVDNNDADNDSLNNQRFNITLQGLTFSNGTYKLEGPYCVLYDWESPSDIFPELADSTGFNYTRLQQEFEDVNVYYHIDLSYRWLMSMGYDIPGLYNFSCDPHGLNEQDESHYVPSQNYCAWGEGGVDDSEDAAVIWHEYGHAIQENIPPSMSYIGETKSLQEGSSDYWAASYSRSLYDFGWNQVFIWDAGNTSENDITGTFWPGRRCNLDWVYPDDYVSGHNGGQIWSSALMKMWPELGHTVTDNLFIQAHYIWGSNPGLEDAAQAFIQADRDLFGGTHLSTIVNWFDFHGLVDATQFIPQINHTPFSDTEDIVGPYTVEADIIPAIAPLNTANLFVYWGLNGAFTDSSLLQSTGVTNQYFANIPGTGSAASVNYYISVIDTANNLVFHPANAPVEYHSFYVGVDTISPIIVHTPLRDQAYIRWPATVSANITDNLGISDVTVNYYVNDIGTIGSFQMTDQGNDKYLGTFDIDTTAVSVGDSIFYRITATDNSSNGNITNHPVAGFHSFEINNSYDYLFDFEVDNGGFTGTPSWDWGVPTSGPGNAYQGTKLWATNLAGDYGDNEHAELVTTQLDLSGFNNPKLQFVHWYNIEEYSSTPGLAWDGGNVKISTDGGSNFTLIDPLGGYPFVINASGNVLNGQGAFSGTSIGWELAEFDLSTYAGMNIVLKFDFGTDESVEYAGWYVDSLVVSSEITAPHAPVNLAVLDSNEVVILGWKDVTKNLLNEKLTVKEFSEEELQLIREKEENSGIPGNSLEINKADSYNVYKSSDGITFNIAGSAFDTTYTDTMVTIGNTYYYYVTAVASGMESDPSDTVSTTVQAPVGIKDNWGDGIPVTFAMEQNYPNPFNPVTTIRYQLPKSANVHLAVYNMLGQKVKTLVNENQPAKYYSIQWNGLNETGSKVASGIYLYRIEAGDYIKTNKMLLLK